MRELRRLRGVMAVIEQHVAQRASYLEWCTQRAEMIAAVEDFAASLKEPVRELADPGTDALHPTRDRAVVLRFDE